MYERTETGYRCQLHGVEFSPVETCPHGPDCGELDTHHAAEHDQAALEDEGWCRRQRDKLIAIADEMADGREEREAIDRVGYSTLAKIYDTALKYHRAAMEERVRRGDKEHDRWLVEQNRILRGAGGK